MSLSKIRSIHTKLNSLFFKGQVLVFHSISDKDLVPLFSSGIHRFNCEEFEKKLARLRKGNDFVFVDELVQRVKDGKPLKNLVSITFDDGYLDFAQNALPILEHLNIPSTLFLTTKLSQGGVFWRDKVRYIIDKNLTPEFLEYLRGSLNISHDISPLEFYQDSKNPELYKSSNMDEWMTAFFKFKNIDPSLTFKGLYLGKEDLNPHPLVQYGNHTENHFVMSSLTKDEQLLEIERAQTHLKSLNLPLSEAFAIPFGDPLSFNQNTLDVARELGFKSVLLARADRARGFLTKRTSQMDDSMIVGMRFLPR